MTPEELDALLAAPAPGQAANPKASTTQPTIVPKAAGEMTPADMDALLSGTASPSALSASPAQSGTGSSQPKGMSPEELEALLGAPAPGTSPALAPSAASPQVSTVPSTSLVPDPDGALAFSGEAQADPSAPPTSADRYAGPGQTGAAILTGAAKSIWETKDFIFGKPEAGEKSGLRSEVEGLDKSLGEASPANSFVSGLSQFATGMLGAGAILKAAKAVPLVGGALEAAEGSRKGAALLSSGKAATVGAVAFDPNGGRLSDLVMKFPALQNPVSEFLASQPGDSAALGRAKNALESIGVDAALAGVFAASVAGFKALRGGDQAAIAASQQELVQAVAHKDAKLAASKGDAEALEELRLRHPEVVAGAEAELAQRASTQAEQVTQRSVADLPAAPDAGLPPDRVRPDGGVETTLPELSAQPATTTIIGEGLPVAAVPTTRPSLLGITDDQVSRLIRETEEDTAQLLGPGGFEGALSRGYRFGDGGNIPWQKLAATEGHAPGQAPLDQMLRRVADEFSAGIAEAKGGDAKGVMSDAMADRLVAQRVALYNEDPEALMGALQLAGRDANDLVANVAAADLITQRASHDAQNLADRIRLGMLEEYGGDLGAAMSALRGHIEVAATARAQGASMVANAARTLRRQRADFAFSLEDLAAMRRLPDDRLLNLIEAAGRDPKVVDRLLRRGFWGRVVDDASYLYVNNLLWGLRTHFVNFATNGYMLFGRPLERMIGGVVQGDKARIGESWRQYTYLSATLSESWRDAVQTWRTGESIIAPHVPEVSAASAGRSVNWVAEGYKNWDSIPNVLSNAYVGFMKGAGLPTRALGASDELVKQVIYRSKVLSVAHGEGIAAGLEGPALTEHVSRTLHNAFDDAGRAVDLKALDEANIATFQQDLLPNTVGAWVQSGTNAIPALRFVVPFVRTPTNVLRIGWKMTPGLNMAQKEYRQMIWGEMGPEKQAQAIGQGAIGSLFMGTAAMLAHAGFITGGGPSDAKLRKELMATGWQPYSFVVPGADEAPTYVNFGRFDPVAMPFGIMADVVTILERDQDGDGHGEKAMAALGGVFLSLVKQLGQKTYLTSLHDTIEAVTAPERSLGKTASGMAANFVPFASGLRFANPDPLMRETRGVVDKIMATVPGLSERLPAQRDIFGDPLTVHKGLWVNGKGGLVDAEMRRLIVEAEVGPFGPPGHERNGVDLRDVTMKDGRNAFDVYQELEAVMNQPRVERPV